jgi:hypothetical protein
MVGIGDVSSGSFQSQPWATQSLLWGSKSMLTPPYDTAPYIEGCGTHDPEAWDDDNPTDLNFSSNECYDNTFGCPTSLNHMIAFGVAQPPCPPCPPTTVTKFYKIKGNANNTPWSWGIAESPLSQYLYAHGTNSGVTGNVCNLAAALVSGINSYAAQDLCSPTNLQATVMSCNPILKRARVRIVAQVCPGSSFNLYTGSGNVDPTCLVPTWPAVGCTFNPEIVEIVPSGQDCNGNGQDDMFDIADGVSNDVNDDGNPPTSASARPTSTATASSTATTTTSSPCSSTPATRVPTPTPMVSSTATITTSSQNTSTPAAKDVSRFTRPMKEGRPRAGPFRWKTRRSRRLDQRIRIPLPGKSQPRSAFLVQRRRP